MFRIFKVIWFHLPPVLKVSEWDNFTPRAQFQTGPIVLWIWRKRQSCGYMEWTLLGVLIALLWQGEQLRTHKAGHMYGLVQNWFHLSWILPGLSLYQNQTHSKAPKTTLIIYPLIICWETARKPNNYSKTILMFTTPDGSNRVRRSPHEYCWLL